MRAHLLLASLLACAMAALAVQLAPTAAHPKAGTCDDCLTQASACFSQCSGAECGDACMAQWRVCSRLHCGSSDPSVSLWAQWNGNAQHSGRRGAQHTPIDQASAGHVRANVTMPSSAYIWSGGAFSESGEVLFWGSVDRKLHAVATDDLSSLWTIDTSGFVGAPAIGRDGMIFFGSQDHSMYAATQNGTIVWKFASPNKEPMADPVLDRQGNVYAGDWAGTAYSWDAKGRLRWSVDMRNVVSSNTYQIIHAGAYTRDGLFVVRFGNYMVALTSKGEVAWKATTAYGGGISLGGRDEEVLCVIGEFMLKVYNGSTGAELWRTRPQHDGKSHYLSGECTYSADGTLIYVGGNDTPYVYALSSDDGSIVWKQSVVTVANRQPYVTTPSVGAEGYVYVVTNNGYAYAMEGSSGTVRWGKLIDGWITATPLVNVDGTVFISSRNGDFVAIFP